MIAQHTKKCKFYGSKNIAKLTFLKKEIWHISHYKKMHIFQAFCEVNAIVFVVEVSRRWRSYRLSYQRTIY